MVLAFKLAWINTLSGVRLPLGNNANLLRKAFLRNVDKQWAKVSSGPTPLKSEQQIIQPYILRTLLLKNLSQRGTTKRNTLIKKKLEKIIYWR